MQDNHDHLNIAFSDHQFAIIKNFIMEKAGIALREEKKSMVYGRLIRRLRLLNIDKFDNYLAILNTSSEEFQHCIDALTTNVTSFFRENHHFDYLKQYILPNLYKSYKRIRIWSAGCSYGHEPYSIAITVAENPPPPGVDLKILATDISSKVVESARNGTYSNKVLDNIDQEKLQKYFDRSPSNHLDKSPANHIDKSLANHIDKSPINHNKEQNYTVKPHIKNLITFNELNLMSNPWPFHGPFQVIFCRNVIIYFNKDTQNTLFERYHSMLDNQNGYLFLGHSENIQQTNMFGNLGKTIYKKLS